MLVLSRKKNETIMITDNIRIVVVEIRLGIEAPQEVAVHRLEVYEAIKRDAAAAVPMSDAQPVINDDLEPQ